MAYANSFNFFAISLVYVGIAGESGLLVSVDRARDCTTVVKVKKPVNMEDIHEN